ncbi:MAG: LolA-related protein, partial [Candidatus Binataceae bacterium]
LIWRLEQPIQTTTLITPDSLRLIIDGREVQQLETARAPFVAHFYDLLDSALSGDWAAMRHDFAVETRGDRRAWRTVLTPRRTSDAIAEVVASIVITGGKMVDVVNIKRANGDSEQLTFLEQTISSLAPGSDDARLLDDNKDLKPRG